MRAVDGIVVNEALNDVKCTRIVNLTNPKIYQRITNDYNYWRESVRYAKMLSREAVCFMFQNPYNFFH